MDEQATAFVVAGVAGTLASSLAEGYKVATGKKPRPAVLRIVVLALVVAIVGVFTWLQGTVNWQAFGGTVLAGWAAALATHDVARPRKK